MKKLLSLLLFAVAFMPAEAQRVIDLPAAPTPLSGAELLSVSLGGAGTRKTTAQDIANLAGISDFVVVSTISDRNAIPNLRRKVGTHAYVVADTSTYKLVNGINNANWRKISIGSGDGGGDTTGYGLLTRDAADEKYVSYDSLESTLSTKAGNNVVQSLTDGATIVWNFTSGNIATVTLAGNRALSLVNTISGDAGVLYAKQDATGGRSLTLKGTQQDSFKFLTCPNCVTALAFQRVANDTFWYSSAFSTVAPTSVEALNFAGSSDFVNTSGNIWTAGSGGASYGKLGKATKKLASGQDGRIITEIGNGANGVNFGFNTVNSETGYVGMEAALAISAGLGSGADIYRIESGAASMVATLVSSGTLASIHRVGALLTLETSANAGVSWSVIYTFTFSSTADLFIVVDSYGNDQGATSGKLVNPQGVNLTL